MTYEIVSILNSILGTSKPYARGEYYYYCPFCHHYNPKLAVNIHKKKWQCWKCGARGGTLLSLLRKLDVPRDQIKELARLLQDELPKYKEDDDSTAVLTLPHEFKPLYESPKSIEAHHALSYLHKRGVSDEDILKYQIGYCEEGKYQNRVIIPSYDNIGKLNFFVGRDYYGTSSLPYLIPSISKNIIGFDFYINWRHPIVLTEGVFDAMAVKRNGLPLFGKTVPKKVQEKIIKEGVKDVYLALDDDALRETLKIAERFLKEGINVYVLELNGKDPSAIGFEMVQELIRNAKPLTFTHLLELKLRLVQV